MTQTPKSGAAASKKKAASKKQASKKQAAKKTAASTSRKKQAAKKQAASKKAPAKRGRPSIYTHQLGLQICERIALDESLREICRDPKMPGLATVVKWLVDDEHTDFQAQYARARQAQAELEFDEMRSIADDNSRDIKEDSEGFEYVDHDAIQRARLRVDTRKWRLARMSSKRYGDKVEHDHKGELRATIYMDTQPPDQAGQEASS